MEDRRLIAEGAIHKLLEAGGDKAQCKVVMKETREFNVNGGVFSLFRTLFDKSLTLSVIKDHKVGNVSRLQSLVMKMRPLILPPT